MTCTHPTQRKGENARNSPYMHLTTRAKVTANLGGSPLRMSERTLQGIAALVLLAIILFTGFAAFGAGGL